MKNIKTIEQFLNETYDNLDYHNINECTIVGSKMDDKIVLVKNRDRNYHPKVKIVHELINDIEVVYMLDTDTDYSEGMNEFGIGIINATLQGGADEKQKSHSKKSKKSNIQSKDGFKIRTALGYDNINEVIESVITFVGYSTGHKVKDKSPTALNGHTFVGNQEDIYFIEKVSTAPPIIQKLDNDTNIIRTNHGISYQEKGYQKGKDRKSSISRYEKTQELINGISSYKDILPTLNKKQEDLPGWLNPRRYDYKLWTTSQIELNLTDLEFRLVINEDTEYLGIERNLPNGHKDKIKIDIVFDNEEVED